MLLKLAWCWKCLKFKKKKKKGRMKLVLLIPDHLILSILFVKCCGGNSPWGHSLVLKYAKTIHSSKHLQIQATLTEIWKQPKKCASTNSNNTVLFVRLPRICPSGETVNRRLKKWGAWVQCNDVSGREMPCKEIPSTQRAPSIALAKGTDILMEITSFWPLPGTVNTIASC